MGFVHDRENMTPYYEHAGITIYHGDSREVLRTVDHSAETMSLVTDPPYSLSDHFGVNNSPRGTRVMKFDFNKSGQATPAVQEVLEWAFPKVNSFHLFCSDEQYGEVGQIPRRLGFVVKPWVWVKKCHPPAAPGNWWPSGFELAMFGFKSGAWFGDENTKRSNVYTSDTYRHGIRADEKVAHPTQKWLPMIKHIVGSIIPPDGIALDPFMGSGTTLRRPKTLGVRPWVSRSKSVTVNLRPSGWGRKC